MRLRRSFNNYGPVKGICSCCKGKSQEPVYIRRPYLENKIEAKKLEAVYCDNCFNLIFAVER